MWLLKRLFGKKVDKSPPEIPIEEKKEEKEYNLNNIAQFDDLKIQIENDVYEGWVVERIENKVNVVYSDKNNKLMDAYFEIERPFNRNYIDYKGKRFIIE